VRVNHELEAGYLNYREKSCVWKFTNRNFLSYCSFQCFVFFKNKIV